MSSCEGRSLFTKLLLCEKYMTNGRSPSTILLAISDKMSMASEIICNLCYSLIALWGNDKKMLKNLFPKSATLFQLNEKAVCRTNCTLIRHASVFL